MRPVALMAAIGALAAAGSAGAQAPAPSTLSLFRAICVDTAGKPGADLATASDWGELDPQLAPRFAAVKIAFHDPLMRAKHLGAGAGAGVVVAFAGTDVTLPGVQFSARNSACGVMSINTGVDEGDVSAKTGAWLRASAPSYALGPASIFTYVETAGARRVLTAADAAEGQKAMADGKLNLVFVRSEGGQTLFFYLISNPVN